MRKSLGIMTTLLAFIILLGCVSIKAYTSPDYVGMTYSGVKYGQFNKQTT